MFETKPFLQWVGGKRQLLSAIKNLLPLEFNNYYEPFVGGGAVFLQVIDENKHIITINDLNDELINCYNVIKESPNELIKLLHSHKNTKEYYYEVRNLDRNIESFQSLSKVERASRILLLNRLCFNALYRVNKKGEFNVPVGRLKKELKFDIDNILAVSKKLQKVNIKQGNFLEAIQNASKGDFVYFDPPYDPISETSNFTSYCSDSFLREEQIKLKEIIDSLTAKGCYVMISNSSTPFIEELYQGYNIYKIEVQRSLSSDVKTRKKVEEVIITNY